MAKVSKTHNYVMQRNYAYETQHADSKYKGLSEEEWREKILEEWSWRNLKANYVTLIFHYKDKDKDTGEDKGLHVHGVGNFEQSLTQSEALKHSGCSSELHCQPMKDKMKAYRYLLHISEKAIEDYKHIYSEDELIFSVADGRTYGLAEYHKTISKNAQQNEETKEAKKLITMTINDIIDGKYGAKNENDNTSIYDKIVVDDNIAKAMAQEASLYRKVMNAITLQESRDKIAVAEHERELKEKGINPLTQTDEHKRILAGFIGDEWAEYRQKIGVTLEECLEARNYIQDKLAQ